MQGTNLDIAKIQLLSRKRQTAIAILGVTFGIAMFILMISFMKGTNEFLLEAMLSSTPDIHIFNDIKTDYSHSITDEYFDTVPHHLAIVHHTRPKNIHKNLKQVNEIITDLKNNPAVTATSPLVSSHVFFNCGPVQLNGVVEGVDIKEQAQLYDLANKMRTGNPDNLLSADNGILLGQGLADKLNVQMGNSVTLYTPSGKFMRFNVVGTFQFGIGLVDNIKAITNINNVQQLLGQDHGYITDIQVKLKNIREAGKQATLFEKRYGYKAEDWKSANSSLMATTVVRDVLTYVVSFALLIVAGFGIYNIMNMTIMSKMKDIAILKAQGFTGKDIITIFLSQSLIIGVIGSVFGIIAGFLLSYAVSRIPFPPSDLVSLKFFPVLFEWRFYILAVGFGFITTLIAGLMPAIKASKLDPVAILRG